jgi:hypothetical protein
LARPIGKKATYRRELASFYSVRSSFSPARTRPAFCPAPSEAPTIIGVESPSHPRVAYSPSLSRLLQVSALAAGDSLLSHRRARLFCNPGPRRSVNWLVYPRWQPLLSKGLLKPSNQRRRGPIGTSLPAEGELTPRALTSSYTTLRVRLAKTAQHLGLPRRS